MKCPFHAEEEVRLKPRGTPPLWPRCLAVRRFARRSAWSRPFVPDGGDRRLFAGSVLVVLCTDTFHHCRRRWPTALFPPSCSLCSSSALLGARARRREMDRNTLRARS